MAKKSLKGGVFEREFCTRLSEWWTLGASDAVFWRTGGSGGRATVRAKRGRHTKGQYGDVCATDPVGEPLIQFFAIELKRGYSKDTIADVLDRTDKMATQTWEEWFLQATRSQEQAGAYSWMIVHRRDQRQALVYLPYDIWGDFNDAGILNNTPVPFFSLSCRVKSGPKKYTGTREVVGFRLDDWFNCVDPTGLKKFLKTV